MKIACFLLAILSLPAMAVDSIDVILPPQIMKECVDNGGCILFTRVGLQRAIQEAQSAAYTQGAASNKPGCRRELSV